MEEDWFNDAKAPSFNLFENQVTPQEAAKKEGYVDMLTYGRWKKSDRRLYQKMKVQMIAEAVAKDKFDTFEDLSDALSSLNLLREDSLGPVEDIDVLINKVQKLQLEKTPQPKK